MGDHLASGQSVGPRNRVQEHDLPQERTWRLVGALSLAGQSLYHLSDDELSHYALEGVRKQLQVVHETEHIHVGAE
jgi:hypothetical protein